MKIVYHVTTDGGGWALKWRTVQHVMKGPQQRKKEPYLLRAVSVSMKFGLEVTTMSTLLRLPDTLAISYIYLFIYLFE